MNRSQVASVSLVNSQLSLTFEYENDNLSSVFSEYGYGRGGLAISRVTAYIEVLKPLPSLLLAFIGICAAVVAGGGGLSTRLFLVALAILAAAGGANGLTNYLDRAVDARMERTKHRALPSKRISPAQKVLPLVIGLIIVGLMLAWYLHPYAFIADLAGTIAAATWRKRVTCLYPQGMIAGCAPILMGWFAIKPVLTWELLVLCLMIALWLPLHVWSLIISHREDYLQAGLSYFPINWEVRSSVKALLVSTLALYAASMTLYFVGGFAWLYLVLANILGTLMVYASLRLVKFSGARDAWRLYKFSAFPYLGLIFVVMVFDTWLLR